MAELRAGGTGGTITLAMHPVSTLSDRFAAAHRDRFGFGPTSPRVEAVSLRVTVEAAPIVENSPSVDVAEMVEQEAVGSSNCRLASVWLSDRWTDVPVLDRATLPAGQVIQGPAIVLADDGCLMIEPGWRAVHDAGGAIELRRQGDRAGASGAGAGAGDAVAMELLVRRLQGIAESMGETIVRTSVSVNVKERRDFSCAIFRGDGTLLANAAHVPVHLGSMGHAVRSVIAQRTDAAGRVDIAEGDVFIANDPYAGGSHLPDVTVMTPVVVPGSAAEPCDYWVASRCHHAEIGGQVPGSMCPAATCLNDEGVVFAEGNDASRDDEADEH